MVRAGCSGRRRGAWFSPRSGSRYVFALATRDIPRPARAGWTRRRRSDPRPPPAQRSRGATGRFSATRVARDRRSGASCRGATGLAGPDVASSACSGSDRCRVVTSTDAGMDSRVIHRARCSGCWARRPRSSPTRATSRAPDPLRSAADGGADARRGAPAGPALGRRRLREDHAGAAARSRVRRAGPAGGAPSAGRVRAAGTRLGSQTRGASSAWRRASRASMTRRALQGRRVRVRCRPAAPSSAFRSTAPPTSSRYVEGARNEAPAGGTLERPGVVGSDLGPNAEVSERSDPVSATCTPGSQRAWTPSPRWRLQRRRSSPSSRLLVRDLVALPASCPSTRL